MCALVALALLGSPGLLFATNGYFLHAVGTVNESLGGAAAAGNKQDFLGSLNTNPANAGLFDDRTASLSLGVLLPKVRINSSVEALTFNGSSESEVNWIPLGQTGVVINDKTTPTAYYVAIIAEAGLNYHVQPSSENPILCPQAGNPENPFGGLFGGFGELTAQLEVVRIPFGIAYRFNGNWSMGFSVAPSVQRMQFRPSAFAAPDDANGDGIPTYPGDADHSLAVGIGFQAGARYQTTNKLSFGFAITSPTWFEQFEWNVKDEISNTRNVSFRMNRPLSIRLGTQYNLNSETALLMDVSWINFSDTAGFDERGFAADASLAGLGWDDIWVLSLGVQKVISDLILRVGYNYGGNPIKDEDTFFNVASPLHAQHHLSFGGSYRISEQTTLDIAYTHCFKSSQSGPMYDPITGPIPGTEVETVLELDKISMGVTFKF